MTKLFMHSLNKGSLAVSHMRAQQHAHMPKQMPERSSRSMGRKRKKSIVKGEGRFFSSIVCSQVSLSELPPPAVASPAYGRPPVAHAWRATIAAYTSV